MASGVSLVYLLKCAHVQRKVHLVRKRERRKLPEMTVSLMQRGLEMKAPSCSVRLKDEGASLVRKKATLATAGIIF